MNKSYVAIPIERIGACEFCGTVDHHLIEGLCPSCRPKAVTVGDHATVCGGPARRPQGVTAALQQLAAVGALALRNLARDEEPPLGAEADVSHVRRPKGAR